METTMSSLAGARGLFISMLLIGLLALKEFAQSATGARARMLARALPMAIVPLMLLFGLAITLRLTQEQRPQGAQPATAPVHVLATAIPITALPAPASATPAPPILAETLAYSVRKDDLLFDVAQRFGTSVAAITALNPQINPDSLVIGDVLRIPLAAPARAGVLTYTVRSGDTLYDLAPRFNTTVEALAALNPQVSAERLMVGQELRIPIAQLRPAQEHTP